MNACIGPAVDGFARCFSLIEIPLRLTAKHPDMAWTNEDLAAGFKVHGIETFLGNFRCEGLTIFGTEFDANEGACGLNSND